jgi:phosphatidate cytidylyltransferase
MSSLLVRTISAVVAFLLFVGSYYFYQNAGLIAIGTIVIFIGVYEYHNLVLKFSSEFQPLRILFILLSTVLIVGATYSQITGLILYCLIVILFHSITLWILRGKLVNESFFRFAAGATLGFTYCALLPTFALSLLKLPSGEKWFLFLLSVVFSGDIFAYFGGKLFGSAHLMPQVSPNKTIMGAAFGLFGSAFAAFILYKWFFSSQNFNMIMITGIASGFLAQNGDLFESLLKRVAGVKDSGHIMPGHGGVLDRLDGVYFAAPIVYAAALFYGI